MRKSILFLVLISIIGAGFILGRQVYLNSGGIVNLNPADFKISVVKEFWKEALNKANVEKFIISTPEEFYDSSPRCKSSKEITSEQSAEMTLKTQEDGFTRELKKTARQVGEGQFVLLNVKNYREWENESIVEVDFAKTSDLNISEKRFFFLILVNGEWKIFMDASVPNLINEEYAKFECPQ